ncbi:hypothetical protein ABPG75_000779 [Micractinium tetrahymenae]
MASRRQAPGHGWAVLPPDLLRTALQGAQERAWPRRDGSWAAEPATADMEPLLLEDVLSAAATCRAWRHALEQSPVLDSLFIGAATDSKRAWMARAQPGVHRLRLFGSAADAEGQAMVRALRGEATEEVEVARAPRCLPFPSLLPNLRSLTVSHLDCDPAWVAALSQLPLLASLELSLAVPPAAAAAAAGGAPKPPLVLPRLPALASFKAYIEPGCSPLRLVLDQLPALEVELWGTAKEDQEDRGAAVLVATAPAGGAAETALSPAPSRLCRLSLDLSKASVDFRAMPAVASAEVWAAELAGAAELAAASALTLLTLGSEAAFSGRINADEYALDKLWVAEALGTLPPMLRRLCLRGTSFPAELGPLLARARSLHTLCLSIEIPDWMYDEDEEERVITLGPGPLWRSLRALRLPCWDALPTSLGLCRRSENGFLAAAASIGAGEVAGT